MLYCRENHFEFVIKKIIIGMNKNIKSKEKNIYELFWILVFLFIMLSNVILNLNIHYFFIYVTVQISKSVFAKVL